MSLVTSTARSIACSGCRRWALKTFIASMGGPSMHFTTPPQRSGPLRTFSTHSRRPNEARERIQKDEKEISTETETASEDDVVADSDALEAATETATPQPEAHVPWYLQVESPIEPQENVLSARQKIPDLPEHPPPILESLLNHVSVELGMDDLSILDLRAIDPPPALGANLIMIVGTARSEKHLHFSADKLCRWLRTEHRLTPFADGLLGRQELKVKMRRRAKRSRLLSAVGAKATADTELDEGIRTGWICVNVGRVEGGELPKTEEELARAKKVVGFGTGMTGSNVVVQLLTEDKRGEIELERLWMAVLKKTRKEKEDLLAVDDANAQDHASTPVEVDVPLRVHDSEHKMPPSYQPLENNTRAQESRV